MKKQRCYIYTRVSTAMQVDGFSLDAQKEKLKKYADYQDMVVVREFSDEGKSGKNVDGRPQFKEMLELIEAGTDDIDYVLVFKLSRFGRNAADVLSSLQKMQDFGVNLICVEDGIDSSKDAGKFMISVLSAVAEIERDNILVQTMEGRKQKAREGKWNGGFAPYGYKLVDGSLFIAEDEVEVIKIIFDKYINTTMGVAAIAAFLNESGYVKKKRQNNTIDGFAASFVKGVIDNPVYCGKLAYGRRKTEKVQGKRNEFHVVKQDEFMVVDGEHEAIISAEEWKAAQDKRKTTGVKRVKTHSLEHEHILTGILKCPGCGANMYGNVNRKRHPKGGTYRDYFYYACKHPTGTTGHKCDYHKQWGQDIVNDAVAELIKKMVTSPDFEKGIREKIAARVDTSELEQELDGLKKKMRQLEVSKDKIAIQMDNLDVTDSMYEKKYDDLQKRFYDKYDEMALTENHMDEIQSRLAHIRRKQLSGDRIYNFLIAFDKLYDKLSDAEKKEFMGTFVESIELYPERLENGKFLKHIHFRFPVYYNGTVIDDISWENESTVETVVLLSKGAKGPVDLCSARTEVERRMADSRKVKVDFSLEDMDLSEFKGKATYEQIKAYVLEKTGLKVSSLYIAQIKKKCGLDVGENFNPAKSENARQPQCTPEKEDAIMQAFRHFGII